ncbi:MAG: hypothetical protein KAG64_05450 [Bacteroidales bacterium]|nr:hypothetical protein [Bacteroidales bacterium]
MKEIMTILFLIMTTYVYSQDTIRHISGKVVIAKVIEINKEDVKYKKYSNINGPTYLLNKKEIISITYHNGETEVFISSKKEENSAHELEDTVIFKNLTKRNNKVYIESENANAIIHATNAIGIWGYWIITKNKEEADFILKFYIRFTVIGDAFGSAQFIDPMNDKIIKTTKEVNTLMSWDFNTKRGVINKIIKKEIKPLF